MSVFEHSAKSIDGTMMPLETYRGKTLLIVNVASRCGYTPQYAGLERLYRTYKEHGLVVLGFPCDQFGRQEPGTDAEIRDFCWEAYEVTFPMFAKVKVNGDDAHPLYRFLKSQKPGLFGLPGIKWNFTKFLVGPDGEVLKRYGPADTPEAIEADVRESLTGRKMT